MSKIRQGHTAATFGTVVKCDDETLPRRSADERRALGIESALAAGGRRQCQKKIAKLKKVKIAFENF